VQVRHLVDRAHLEVVERLGAGAAKALLWKEKILEFLPGR
jgi:hypothetical protein